MNIDWQTILTQYSDVVWHTAWRLLRNDADVRDCFQETFISAMDAARKKDVRNWPGLLKCIATARALDHLRKQKSYKLFHSQEIPPDCEAPATDPIAKLVNDELSDQLLLALREIPPPQSEAFCLRHLSEMSYEEIAAEMSLSVDHVGVLLHRARERLRELLGTRVTSTNPDRKVNHV